MGAYNLFTDRYRREKSFISFSGQFYFSVYEVKSVSILNCRFSGGYQRTYGGKAPIGYIIITNGSMSTQIQSRFFVISRRGI